MGGEWGGGGGGVNVEWMLVEWMLVERMLSGCGQATLTSHSNYSVKPTSTNHKPLSYIKTLTRTLTHMIQHNPFTFVASPLPLQKNPANMTKEERKEKYTKLAHDKTVEKGLKKLHKNTVCFVCRSKGHAAFNCPKNSQKLKICFKCGSSEHRLDDCPKGSDRTGNLPFAECFVCGGKGHLSGACPLNSQGVYVNGGSCKICGGVDHLETRCPKDKKERKRERDEKRAVSLQGKADVGIEGEGEGGDNQPEREGGGDKKKKVQTCKVINF